ncbi:transcription initiation factor IIB [Halarchaeum grantii]|uniref:Transcription initiation factor IIB n=1 Tax=Halarchaeum grantii TaxID=1193105 RepID=A0A830FA96_9EURY|nr:TFIIB-type zinc ribbon-containing protein [Halarchaeum grantii]GGL34248.1 transcription initiation factor IIB [Halarchaeum grantii]
MATRDIYEDGFDEDQGSISGRCPECEGRVLADGGELACTACGLVLEEERFDHGSEPWFDAENDEARRTGAPLTPARHDRGLSSEIGYGGDANGNCLSPRKRAQIARLRREHTRARWRSKAERNLATAFTEIRRLVSALESPRTVAEEACTLYRRAQSRDLIRGRSIEMMAAGSVYAACRCRNVARPPPEIAAVASCSRSDVVLGYGVLNRELGLDAKPVGVHDRVPAIASTCDVADAVTTRAFELADIAESCGIANGRHPRGVAAACLYLAARETEDPITQQTVATAASVSDATVRNRIVEFQPVLEPTTK